MTVAGLIALLQELPPDRPLVVAGPFGLYKILAALVSDRRTYAWLEILGPLPEKALGVRAPRETDAPAGD